MYSTQSLRVFSMRSNLDAKTHKELRDFNIVATVCPALRQCCCVKLVTIHKQAKPCFESTTEVDICLTLNTAGWCFCTRLTFCLQSHNGYKLSLPPHTYFEYDLLAKQEKTRHNHSHSTDSVIYLLNFKRYRNDIVIVISLDVITA